MLNSFFFFVLLQRLNSYGVFFYVNFFVKGQLEYWNVVKYFVISKSEAKRNLFNSKFQIHINQDKRPSTTDEGQRTEKRFLTSADFVGFVRNDQVFKHSVIFER